MSALGSLVVKLALEYAQYTQGLNTASQDSLKFAKSIQDTTDKIGKSFEAATSKAVGAIAGLATAYVGLKSFDAFKGMVESVVASAAAMKDMSEKTGATVESLSALIAVGKLSGTSADTITAAMNKLAKGMAVSNEESKGVGEALKALGINFNDFNKMSPDEKMVTLSKTFAEFADGSGKSAVAMTLMGKAGAEMLPYLRDLSEVGDLAVKMTTEQAYAADEYEKSIKRAAAAGEAWKKQIALALLPVMSETAQAFVEVYNGAGGVKGQIADLAKDGSITDWARSAVTAVTYVIDAVQVTGRAFSALGKIVGATFAYIEQARQTKADIDTALTGLDFKGAFKAAEVGAAKMRTILEATRGDLAATITMEGTLGEKLRQKIGEIRKTPFQNPNDGKPQVNFNARDTPKAGAKEKDEEAIALQKLTDEIQKYNNELDAQFNQTEKLSKAQELLVAVQANNTSEIQKLSKENRDALAVELQLVIAKEKRNAAAEKERKANEEAAKAQAKYVEEQVKTLDKYREEADSERRATEEIGLSSAAIKERKASRLEDQAAQLEGMAIKAQDREEDSALADIYKQQAAALRERAQAMRAGYEKAGLVEEAQKEAEALKALNDRIGQSLSDALMQGGKSAWEYIKGLFRSTVLQPVIQAVLAPVTGGLSSLAQSFTGASGSGGGQFDLGGLFTKLQDGLSGSISNAFNSFASSSFGGQLGLSTQSADLTGLVSRLPTEFASSFGKVLGAGGNAFAGYGLSKGISGGYSVTGGNALNNIGAAASLYFGPIAGVVTGAINRLFGKKLQDVSIEGTLGGSANFAGKQVESYKGGLFSSNSKKTSELDAGFSASIATAVDSMKDKVRDYAKALALPVDAIDGYTEQLKISTKGLKPEEIQAKVEEALKSFNTGLFNTLASSVEPFAKTGESVQQTIERLGSAIAGVNPVLDSLGLKLFDVSAAGGDAASRLADLFGGVGNLSSSVSSFYGAFYKESEKVQRASDQVAEALGSVGLTMPKTREEFRALVEAQDLNTESGAKAFAALLGVAGAFDQVTKAGEEAAQVAQEQADEAKKTADEVAKAAAEAEKAILEAAIALQNQLNEAIDSNIGKFQTQDQQQNYQASKISFDLSKVGVDIDVGTLLRATKAQIFDFADAFVRAGDKSVEAKLAVVNAAGALADLRDQADSAAENLKGKLDGVIGDFLSGDALVQYKASRVQDKLAAGGVDVPIENIINATKDQVRDLFNAVGIEGKNAVVDAYAVWKDLQQVIHGASDALLEYKNSTLAVAIEAARSKTLTPEARIGALKAKEKDLFGQLQTSNDPISVANKLQETIIARLNEEGALRQQQQDAEKESLQARIDGAEKLKDLAGDIAQFTGSLKFGNLSPLNARDQVGAAKDLYERTLSQAKAGDEKAIGNLLSNAQAYLEEASSAFASSGKYVDVFNQVTAQLDELGVSAGASDTTISVAKEQLDKLGELTDNGAEMLDALLKIDEALSNRLGLAPTSGPAGSGEVLNLANPSAPTLPGSVSSLAGPTTSTPPVDPAVQRQTEQLVAISDRLSSVVTNTARLSEVVSSLNAQVSLNREGFTAVVSRLVAVESAQRAILSEIQVGKAPA